MNQEQQGPGQYFYVDQQGQQVQDMQDPSFMSNTPMVDNKADILDKIRPELIVDMIRHKLMGEEMIDGKWVKVPALQYRSLTEAGAWELANLMVAVSSQNVALSSLKDEEIKPRLKAIVTAAMYKMLRNWKEYGVQGTDQFYYVKEIIYSNTLVSLKQPEHGGIRKMIMGVRTENVTSNNSQDKPSFMEGLFRKR